jgi:hypothetical protein
MFKGTFTKFMDDFDSKPTHGFFKISQGHKTYKSKHLRVGNLPSRLQAFVITPSRFETHFHAD